jgi:DNA uptake protein ComE-like DNA-binding protein
MKFLFLLATTFLSGLAAFAPTVVHPQQQRVQSRRRMAVDVTGSALVDRRSLLANAATVAAATVLVAAAPALALNTIPADNEIVKEQRTVVTKLDVNNAPVADYMQFPGLYPTIGGKIANNGPYASLKDIYKLKILSADEKDKIKGYEGEFMATASTGLDVMRGRDPYRRSFNK